VKLARNGIIFFSLPGNHVTDIVGVLAKIFQAMELGEIKRPFILTYLHVHQETTWDLLMHLEF